MEKEIKIKVSPDTYNEIRNIFHNEYGIKKEDVEKEVNKIIKQAIDKRMNEHNVDEIFTEYLEKYINKILSELNWNKQMDRILAERFQNMIDEKIKELITLDNLKKILG
jgi:DnaJ-domain-containing protein 1